MVLPTLAGGLFYICNFFLSANSEVVSKYINGSWQSLALVRSIYAEASSEQHLDVVTCYIVNI